MTDAFTEIFSMISGQFGGGLFFAFIIFIAVLVMVFFIFGIELVVLVGGMLLFIIGMAFGSNAAIIVGLMIMSFSLYKFLGGF